MKTVIVQVPEPQGAPAATGRPRQLALGPGEVATFGRGTPERPVDVPLTGEGVSRFAGELVTTDDHWRLSNFSPRTTYVVENLEGGGEYVKVAPRRLGAPIPFELSRVVLPLTDTFVRFTVFAPQHMFLEAAPDHPAGRSEDLTLAPFALDPTAKYFLVLLALCEPRLRDPSCPAVPSAGEVADRLRALPGCRDLTVSAVNFHIDYLAGTKLRLRERTGTPAGGRLDWKREALVSLALRFDLVREEHLRIFWGAGA